MDNDKHGQSENANPRDGAARLLGIVDSVNHEGIRVQCSQRREHPPRSDRGRLVPRGGEEAGESVRRSSIPETINRCMAGSTPCASVRPRSLRSAPVRNTRSASTSATRQALEVSKGAVDPLSRQANSRTIVRLRRTIPSPSPGTSR